MDDTKISHHETKIVTEVISQVEERFGKMVVTRGKKHNFVGMDVEFMDNCTVKILMKEYITECFEAFGEKIDKKASTPGKHNLFDIKEVSSLLTEDKMKTFHHIVAQLLYVSKRASVDIDLVVSYLCTRVSCIDDDDWEKLRRLLHYLYTTIDIPRIIGAGGLDILQTYVDASYAVHNDMKSHT